MHKITQTESRKICRLLADRAGVMMNEDRLDLIAQAISESMQALKYENFEDYYRFISLAALTEPHLQALIDQVTIGETFFFRDDSQFKALRNAILPELIQRSRASQEKIHILSAGCSSGEEPYSIAILLEELLPANEHWRIDLIGGDINLTALAKANLARYGHWSFRGVAPEICNRYFEKDGNLYQLSSDIRSRVNFQYLNLAEELPFFGLDLILLRNVTIYFSGEFKQQLAQRCARALKDDGLLLLAAGEINQQYYQDFEEYDIGGITLYRKNIKNSSKSGRGTTTKRKRMPAAALEAPALPYSPPRATKAVPAASNNGAKPAAAANRPSAPAPAVKPLAAKTLSKKEEREKEREEIYRQAEQYFDKSDLVKAEELIARIFDNEPRAVLLLAKIEANRGHYAQSEDLCRRYLSKHQESLEAHYLLGLIYQAEHKPRKAAESLRYATFLDRDFIMGHWHLALVYQQLDDKQAARRHLMRARSLLAALPGKMVVKLSEGQQAARILQIVEKMLNDQQGAKK